MLCASANETANAVENLMLQNANLAREITDLKRTLNTLKADMVESSCEPFILFENDMSISDMRSLANKVVLKRPSVYIFSPSEKGGFCYLCAGENMKSFLEKLNYFPGRGGGSDKMIQGTILASETEIKDFLTANIDK
jgi:hypothetical protein